MAMNNERKVRKIAFFDSRYHSFYGAQRSCHTLVTNLDRQKTEAVFITMGEGELPVHYREAGIRTLVLKPHPIIDVFDQKVFTYGFWQKVILAWALLVYNWKIFKLVRREGIDVFYSNDFRSTMMTGFGARAARVPLVTYIRSDAGWQKAGKYNSIVSIALALSNKVILIADNVRHRFSAADQARHGHKFTTIYTGFLLEEPEENGCAASRTNGHSALAAALVQVRGKRVAALVGSVCHRKGHDLLVEAVRRMPPALREQVHFLFVGGVFDGNREYAEALRATIRRYDLDDKFTWLGYQGEMSKIYPHLDFVVLPSRSEGLPRVVIEALGHGVPVVCTNVGGASEILRESELGVLIEPEDVDALEDALADLLTRYDLDDPELRRRRREFVANSFSMDAFISRFEEVIALAVADAKR